MGGGGGSRTVLGNAGVVCYHNAVHAQNSAKLLRVVGLTAAALFALALGWLCWQAWFDPGIQFFPPGTAPWIVYPSPPRVHTFPVQNLPAVFRRQFVLPSQPSKALLDWRCFHTGRLWINGGLSPCGLRQIGKSLCASRWLANCAPGQTS